MATKPTAIPLADLNIVECPDDADWERWLTEHHATAADAWVKIAKKGSGVTTVHYPEVLNTAICFGWIDAVRRPLDDTYFLQRFTPRGPRSKWSQVNREKALALTATGRMRAAGHAQVNAAQADGRWEAAYEPQSRASIPQDLQTALDAHPRAREFFATLKGQQRYAFLYRLHNVKTEQGRQRRIANYIELLSEGKTLN
ncbi:MAG TPA: YdeI/OmpD-associated family protein [Solirubrobacteraceae bacterium]|nr:YdeI/OmpD-associated family protein [Solirubrobacteraceae bacterium]